MKRFSRIFTYLKDYKGQAALYVLCTILATVFSVVSIGMLAPVLNVIFNGAVVDPIKPNAGAMDRFIHTFQDWLLSGKNKADTLGLICITLVIFVLLKNVFLTLSNIILIPIRNSIMRRLRNDMFEKLLTMPIGYFTDERKSTIVSRMTNEVNELQTSIISMMQVFVSEPLQILVFLGTMIFISPKLSLFLILFLPVTGLTIGRIGSAIRRYSRSISAQSSDIVGVVDETVAGMRVVKAFNAERAQYLRFLKLNNENFRSRNKSGMVSEMASPISETMGVLIIAVILWYGGRLVLGGDPAGLKASEFLTYIALFSQLISPFKTLTTALNQGQKGAAALEQIEEILGAKNVLTEKPDAKSIRTFNDKIELRNVHFAYGDKEILKGIDLTIPKGHTVALVGSSGAGKSTLADLVPRFHDVTSGEILIDGINVKDLKLDDLRRLMGVVTQDPILFNDTIASNIMLGTGGATPEHVLEAATVAHAEKFIANKPDGYETVVGDRGSRLSGGERQRITIARAVLKNPPVLILDEATSSLDTESERLVQVAINKLMENRTCIVIAHRLSTVKHADEIIVMDGGRIAERGTHDSLIAANGIYTRLVEMQEVK